MATAAPTGDTQTTQRIVNDLDANFIVEAGAGTGKTYALVSRAVALVKAGHPMPGIVAITFTEAAAAELSERIRARLEQLLDDRHPDNHTDLLAADLSDDHRQHIQNAIAELDQASIQTIHSFAAQLLRERPLSVGLPPGWGPLDEVETKERFNKEWDKWLERALGEGTGVGKELRSALTYLIEDNISINVWRKIAQSFSDKYDRLRASDSLVYAIPSVDISAVADDTLRELRKLCELDRNRTGTSASLLDQLNGAINAVQSARQVSDDTFSVARVVREKSVLPTRRGGNPAIRQRFTAAGTAFKESLQTACLAKGLMPLLHNLRQHFAVDYEAQRKAKGVATFDDLLVWARDLLRDDAHARQHFRDKYSHILIDEFQDTDPLQAEIAFYLAAAPDADIHNQPWHTLPLTPGKLFIVGDPKQSIYRFRNADLAVVQQVKDGGQLQPLSISENRRSQNPVLHWVNAVFGGTDDASGLVQEEPGIQADYIPLQPNAGIQQESLGTVQIFGGDSTESADAVRRQQAKHVANLIAAYAGDSAAARLNMYDKGSKNIRPANLGDVCLLIRSRNGLGVLTRALDDAAIPYRLEGASLFFDTQEVQDMLNCLRAIDDPADEVSVVAALRSPAFACSDADLLRWRDAGGQTPVWNYQSRRLDADAAESGDQRQAAPSVWQGMQKLREYHERSRTESVAQLIAQFIRDRRLDELDLAETRPRETWRRRQFLVEQARNLEYDSAISPGVAPFTLRRFLGWAESRQEENARITEVAVPETDDDAVRIMTMHAAKGLEFPIVILLGLDYDPAAKSGPNGYPTVLHGASGNPIEVLAGSWNRGSGLMTPGYQAAIATEDKHSDAEAIRLAYVGATRARDHLLVSLYHGVNQKGESKDLIHRIANLPDLPHRPAPVDIADTPQLLLSKPDAIDAGDYDFDSWQHSHADNIKQRSLPQAVTATSLAHPGRVHSDGDRIEDKEPSGDPPPTTGRGGTAFGSALHSVLQNTVDQMLTAEQLPLPPGTPVADLLKQWDGEIEKLAKSAAKAQGLTGRDGEIITLTRRALQNDSVAKALRAPRLWPEIPVAAPIDTSDEAVVIEGIIDLLYQDDDGQLVILDYKSDDIKADELDDRMKQHYQWQGAAYAAAIKRATGREVKDVQFLFVRLDGPARSVANWRNLVEEVAQRAAEPAIGTARQG